MLHHPIPSRILSSDKIPLALIPRGGLFLDVQESLWMRLDTPSADGWEFLPAVSITGGKLSNFRDTDLVRPASGAFVGFVAGSADLI